MKYDVFISYSRKDTAIADQICAAFDKAKITYFIDRQGIGGGMEFPQLLAENILDSKIFLFLGSKNSYESKFTNNEILFAFNKKPHNSILPYLIDNSPLPVDYQFTFASINIRNIEEHPIETILIDDIYKLLGRIWPNTETKPKPQPITNESSTSESTISEQRKSIMEEFPEYKFKPVSLIKGSKINNKKGLFWIFGGYFVFNIIMFAVYFFGDQDEDVLPFLMFHLTLSIIGLFVAKRSPNYSLSDIADYTQKRLYPCFFVKNGKFGVLGFNLKILIPAKYDKLTWKTKNKILIAEKNGESFLIDIKGNRLN